MKKTNLKSLQLNKKQISSLYDLKGGIADGRSTDYTTKECMLRNRQA